MQTFGAFTKRLPTMSSGGVALFDTRIIESNILTF